MGEAEHVFFGILPRRNQHPGVFAQITDEIDGGMFTQRLEMLYQAFVSNFRGSGLLTILLVDLAVRN